MNKYKLSSQPVGTWSLISSQFVSSMTGANLFIAVSIRKKLKLIKKINYVLKSCVGCMEKTE